MLMSANETDTACAQIGAWFDSLDTCIRFNTEVYSTTNYVYFYNIIYDCLGKKKKTIIDLRRSIRNVSTTGKSKLYIFAKNDNKN